MPVHINYLNKVANGLNFIHLQEDAMQMHQLYQLFISKYSTVRTKDSSHPERAMAAPLNQGYLANQSEKLWVCLFPPIRLA